MSFRLRFDVSYSRLIQFLKDFVRVSSLYIHLVSILLVEILSSFDFWADFLPRIEFNRI